MNGANQPIQTRAIVMESRRAEAVVNGWKPAGPIYPLLEGALNGCASMKMQLNIGT